MLNINSFRDLSTSSDSNPATAASVFLHKSLKQSGSIEMSPADFDSLLNTVHFEVMAEEEPRLSQILTDVNFQNLCRFLLQHYEGEHRCRYFVRDHKSYLIITNPSYLDSAAMFRNDASTGLTDLLLMFKNVECTAKVENEPFSSNAIHKLFEDVRISFFSFL